MTSAKALRIRVDRLRFRDFKAYGLGLRGDSFLGDEYPSPKKVNLLNYR